MNVKRLAARAAMAADACRATLLSGLAQFRAEFGPSACAVPFLDHVLQALLFTIDNFHKRRFS